MNTSHIHVSGSVYSRILWLYGLYTLLFNVVFLIGYHWLPEGFMRDSPQASAGRVVAEAQTFGEQFGLTLFFNLGMVTLICVVMNFNQIKGVPVGYLYPFFLGIPTHSSLGRIRSSPPTLRNITSVMEWLYL